MKLHASGEDYLEAILILQKKGAVHSVDVARHLGVTKASVSYAVSALCEGGLLIKDNNNHLSLTAMGREIAYQVNNPPLV